MKSPTKTRVAEALEKAAKQREWGHIDKCPLCNLFKVIPHKCANCGKATGLGYCLNFAPEGQSFDFWDYVDGLIPIRKRGEWRRAANKVLLARAAELRAEDMNQHEHCVALTQKGHENE